MGEKINLFRGTLDMLILKAVSLGPQHGYGVLLRIQQLSKGNLQIEQGSLYPALHRLEHKGLIQSEWGESDNNRKAKFYQLTSAGKRQLRLETESWKRFGETLAVVLNAISEEV
jgi:PadR family transcriptional regulator PadR